MNAFVYDPKAGSKHAYIVDASVAYDEHWTGQIVILVIQQSIEMKCLDHHLFAPFTAT